MTELATPRASGGAEM